MQLLPGRCTGQVGPNNARPLIPELIRREEPLVVPRPTPRATTTTKAAAVPMTIARIPRLFHGVRRLPSVLSVTGQHGAELIARGDAQLPIDVAQVLLDGSRREKQALGNLAVCSSLRPQGRDAKLPPGQRPQRRSVRCAAACRPPPPAHREPAGRAAGPRFDGPGRDPNPGDRAPPGAAVRAATGCPRRRKHAHVRSVWARQREPRPSDGTPTLSALPLRPAARRAAIRARPAAGRRPAPRRCRH